MQPIADAHCDFLYFAALGEYKIDTLSPDQVITLNRLKKGDVKLQLFAAWTDKKAKAGQLQQCLKMIETYHKMVEKHDCLEYYSRDFDPRKSQRIATVLTVEDGGAIEGELDNIDLFYRLGVRAMTLTWNNPNELGNPAIGRHNTGITALGRRAVLRMQGLNMAIDLAHLSDAGIDEILSITAGGGNPPFSSHTNCREVYLAKRSLIDPHIKEIARQGGIICINFFPPQLSESINAGIKEVILHIDHAVEVGGIDCVALGSDFDGMNKYPFDLYDPTCFPALTSELISHGYSEADVEKIAYSNLAGYMSRFV